jgi:hypothetical protein
MKRHAENPPSTSVNPDAPLADLDVAFAISLACARCGLSHKEAAILMELDPAQWSRQLNSREAHVSLQRLRAMPRAFWIELLLIFAPPLDVVVAHPDIASSALAHIADLTHAVVRFVTQQQTLRRAG